METLEALCFVGGWTLATYTYVHAHKKAGIRKLYREDHDDRDKSNRNPYVVRPSETRAYVGR
jgi:hypothetical protein